MGVTHTLCKLSSASSLIEGRPEEGTEGCHDLPPLEGDGETIQHAKAEAEGYMHFLLANHLVLTFDPRSVVQFAHDRIQLRRRALNRLDYGQNGVGLGRCKVLVETPHFEPQSGLKPASDASCPRFGHQRRTGCVQRATEGKRQDGGLEQRGEDLGDSGGPGALGRVTSARCNGGRELDALEGDGRIDLRHGSGKAAQLRVREDVRH